MDVKMNTDMLGCYSFLYRLADDLDKLPEIYDLSSCTEEYLEIVKQEREALDRVIQLDRARWNTTPRLYENLIPVFEVLLVDHCNHNCAYCNHWSNIAPKHFYDYDNLIKDLERLSYLYDGKCAIKFMGGEPTLYPNLKEILKKSSKLFKYETQFLTNGIVLLNNIKEEDYSLFEVCKENNVYVEITKYPDIDYTPLEDTLKNFSIRMGYSFNFDTNIIERSTMQVHGVNINGNPEWKNRHLVCGNSNMTINMKDGKIYACPFKACLNIFIKYFGLEDKMKVTEEDYIDIYKVESSKEIAKFLTKGTPACQYCTGDTMFFSPENHPWRKTLKSITEWYDEKGLEESYKTYKFDILKKRLI